MPIAKVADRGAVGDTASSTTTVVDLAAGGSIGVGNYLIARLAVDNAGTNGAFPGLTITDPRSNTWVVEAGSLRDPGSANAGVAVYLAYCKVANGYVNGDDLTFTYDVAVVADCIVVEEWSGIHATTPIAVSAVSANGSSATPTVGPITPTAAGQLVYGVLGAETRAPGFAGDGDTTDGSWTALTDQSCDTGTNTGSQSVTGGYKLVTGTSAQTWNPTINSNDWAGVVIVFAAAAASTVARSLGLDAGLSVPSAGAAAYGGGVG